MQVENDEVQAHRATAYATKITFRDKDLRLGGMPLFVEGYIHR